ncbi:MAG: TIM barrel protein [Nanobdellota archaeon]
MRNRFGPGGTDKMGYEKGIPHIAMQGLSAMEVEFTYGVNMSEKKALEIKNLAKKNNIKLSVHAPYYVNLASPEKHKVKASVERILKSSRIAELLGAHYVVFHPGFYQKLEPKEVYDLIKCQIILLQESLREEGLRVKLAPETTGKISQFGSLEELMQLHKETGCHVCVDFAHLKARNQGEIDYNEVFEKLKPLNYIHAHFSGIQWGEKGERKHILTTEDVIQPFLEAAKKSGFDMTVINESPSPVEDALKMKRIFEAI